MQVQKLNRVHMKRNIHRRYKKKMISAGKKMITLKLKITELCNKKI